MAPSAGAFTTLVTTNTGAASLVVGGATGGATTGTGRINAGSVVLSAGMALSGGTISTAGIVIPSAVPSSTAFALYNSGGNLFFNGVALAAGSSVSGTSGTICKFTSATTVGDSLIIESGSTVVVGATLNVTTAIQLGGVSINTAGTLTNVPYLNAANVFTSVSGQRFTGGIALSAGTQSTAGLMLPDAVPSSSTTNLHNNGGTLTWFGGIACEFAGVQIKARYDSLNYCNFTVASDGKTAITPTGNRLTLDVGAVLCTGNVSAVNVDASGQLSVVGTAAFTTTASFGGAVSILTGLTTTGAVINVNTAEPSVVANDIIGRVDFKAPNDGAGGDANLLAASVVAIAENTFSSTVNATTLSFRTGASEAATEKMKVTSAGVVTITNLATGNLTSASGVITSSSDARLKQDVKFNDAGLPEVLKLRPVTYRWNEASGIPTKAIHAGFIAQEVEAVLPLAVSHDGADGMLGLNDRAILCAVVNAIKTMNDRIEKSVA